MPIKRGDPKDLANVRSNVYHHYIRVDNPKSLIFLSGQLSRDSDGKLVGAGDMAEQTRQAIRNMRTVLESAGGMLEDGQLVDVVDDAQPVGRVDEQVPGVLDEATTNQLALMDLL